MLKTVASRLHEAEASVIANNNTGWTQLRDEMATVHSKMVKTNSTAIKNSKILQNNTITSEHKVKSLEEKILLQTTIIDNLNAQVHDTEDRITKLREFIKNDNIDSDIKRNLETIVMDICKSELTIENLGPILDDKVNNYYDEKMKTISDQSCEIMQDKANAIMANVDMQLNKQQHIQVAQGTTYKNTNPIPINDNHNQNDRNPLFPHVDPLTIGQYRNKEEQYPNLSSPDKYDGNSMFTEKETTFHDNEYVYNSRRHFVNTNTFYKLKWNTKCTGENDIMSFYESLQHMASTCGIPMRNLDEIDDDHGVCPLDPNNCQNYEQIYKLMKGAVF